MFDTYKEIDWVSKATVTEGWHPPYASKFLRIVAALIDWMVFYIFYRLLEIHLGPYHGVINQYLGNNSFFITLLNYLPAKDVAGVFMILLSIYTIFMYIVLLTKSSTHGTWGQWVVKIYVTDDDYLPLKTWQSLKRFFALLTLPLTAFLGFFVSLFTKEGQALHDKLSKTILFSGELDLQLPRKIAAYQQSIYKDEAKAKTLGSLSSNKKSEW